MQSLFIQGGVSEKRLHVEGNKTRLTFSTFSFTNIGVTTTASFAGVIGLKSALLKGTSPVIMREIQALLIPPPRFIPGCGKSSGPELTDSLRAAWLHRSPVRYLP